MNVMMTTMCNLRCPYCFAIEWMHGKSSSITMPLSMSEKILDFLRSIGMEEFRMVGGEPTLHPDFVEFVDRVMASGLILHLFTNGLWSNKARQKIEQIPMGCFKALININEPQEMTKAQRRSLQYTLEWARSYNQKSPCESRVINIGVNIHNLKKDYGFILESALLYEFPIIRISPAFPIVGSHNVAIQLTEYRQYGHLIYLWAKLLYDRFGSQLNLVLDCVVPLCRTFSKQQIDNLLAWGNVQGLLDNCCSNSQTIMPDGSIIGCFIVSSLYKVASMDDLWGKPHNEIVEQFVQAVRKRISAPAIEECRTCSLYMGICQGGCLGYAHYR